MTSATMHHRARRPVATVLDDLYRPGGAWCGRSPRSGGVPRTSVATCVARAKYGLHVSLVRKLQITPGHRIAVLRRAAGVDLGIASGDIDDDPAAADAAILFVTTSADLSTPAADAIVESARRDAVTWVVSPKARQLGTDLNRDLLAALLSEKGIRLVRQIAIDDVWCALSFRPGP